MADATTPVNTPAPTPAAAPASTPAPVPEATPKLQVADDEKFFAALGYFAFLFIVTLVAKPKSAYCKFHAKQSMVLFLTTIVVLIVLAAIPLIGSLLTLALFAVYVLAIYRSYMGEMWQIPVVSSFSGKMDLEALYGKAGLAITTASGLKDKAGSLAGKATEAVKTIGKQEEETPKQPEPPTTPVVLPPAAPKA